MTSSTYAATAFAEHIGVSKTSVNHYVSILEEQGYKVSRNARQHREFTDKDIEIVKALITLNKKRGIKLKEAAQLVMAPGFEVDTVANQFDPLTPQIIDPTKYDDLARSMELLATHVYGIEQQNAQLIELIQAQRTQNDLLMDQNNTLKQELGSMMNHLLQKANEPAALPTRRLDRVEQQNSAIMNALNRINTQQHEQQLNDYEAQKKEKQTGLFAKLLKK